MNTQEEDDLILSRLAASDLNTICRTCLSTGRDTMNDLFSRFEAVKGASTFEAFIHDMIYCCTQITMSKDDGLPAFLCISCTDRLATSFTFCHQTSQADRILKTFLASQQSLPTKNVEEVLDLKVRSPIDTNNYDDSMQIDTSNEPMDVYSFNDTETKQSHRQIKKSRAKLKHNVQNESVEETIIHKHNTRSRLKTHNDNVAMLNNSNVRELNGGDTGNVDDGVYSFADDEPSKRIDGPFAEDVNRIRYSGRKKLSRFPKKGDLLVRSVDRELNKISNNLNEDFEKSLAISEDDLKEEHDDEEWKEVSDDGEDNNEIDDYSNEGMTKMMHNLKNNLELPTKKNEKTRRKTHAPLYDFPHEAQTCSICGHNTSSVSALVKHRAQTHGPKKYQCLTCGNGFTTTRGLRIHLRLHSGEKPEICQTCGKAFSDPRTLKNHERIHSGNQPFPCEVCGKRFPARLPLAHHLRSHTGERPHRCPLCHKGYVQANSLQVHMRSHTGVKPYPCKNCDKAFTNSTSLSVHMLTHNGVKNYQCPVCGKRMARSGELTVHLRMHSGERPFPCSTCGKAFTTSSALRAHAPTHTGVKNFVCTVCGKRVARAMELRVHMRTHTGERRHACQHCPRRFSTSSNRRLHERKHTGEKPFACAVCKRTFADSHVLRHHQRTHSGERPHACAACGRAFAQLATLRAHLNTHTQAAKKIVAHQQNTETKTSPWPPDEAATNEQTIRKKSDFEPSEDDARILNVVSKIQESVYVEPTTNSHALIKNLNISNEIIHGISHNSLPVTILSNDVATLKKDPFNRGRILVNENTILRHVSNTFLVDSVAGVDNSPISGNCLKGNDANKEKNSIREIIPHESVAHRNKVMHVLNDGKIEEPNWQCNAIPGTSSVSYTYH